MEPRVAARRAWARSATAVGWLAAFLATAVLRNNFRVPKLESYLLLVAAGIAHVLFYDKAGFRSLLAEFRSLWIAVASLAVGISLSELFAIHVFKQGHGLSNIYWIGLLATTPLLTYFLRLRSGREFFFGVVTLLLLWHFVAMPVEAFFGKKITWHEKITQFGGFLYQASGLAITRVFFAGFYIPLFYLAVGPLWEKKALAFLPSAKAFYVVLSMIWVFIAMCSGSRAGFIGACLASYLFVFFISPGIGTRIAFFVLPLAGFYLFRKAHIFTGQLFSAYQVAIEVRWSNLGAYATQSMEWPMILTGHGAMFARESVGLAPPRYLTHAHNDLVENAFRWGIINLGFYLVLWYQILRLTWTEYLQKSRIWPLCVLIAFVPSLVVESGFSQFEKATFLIILIGVLTSFRSPPVLTGIARTE